MAAALTDSQLAQISRQLSQHPEILASLQADTQKIGGRFQYMHPNDPRARETPKKVLAKYGIDFPDAADYQILVDPSGQVELKRNNWFQRNSDWVLPVATIGTAGVGSYLAGGSAAGTTSGSYIANDVASTASAASGGGAAAGGVAAGSGSTLHDLLPTIIGSGAAVAGSVIAAKGQSAASKAEAEAAERALQLTKEQYALQRQDSAPYRALGQGAVQNLGYLGGIDVDSKVPELSSTVPKVPYGQTLSTLGQQPPQNSSNAVPRDPGQMVSVRSPQGQVGQVPASMLQHALAAGGTQV